MSDAEIKKLLEEAGKPIEDGHICTVRQYDLLRQAGLSFDAINEFENRNKRITAPIEKFISLI